MYWLSFKRGCIKRSDLVILNGVKDLYFALYYALTIHILPIPYVRDYFQFQISDPPAGEAGFRFNLARLDDYSVFEFANPSERFHPGGLPIAPARAGPTYLRRGKLIPEGLFSVMEKSGIFA